MNKTQTILGEIADIQTGYVFRSKVQSEPNGNLRVIQSKNLADGCISRFGQSRVNIPARGKLWRVQEGDILLRSRGNDIGVAVVEDEPQEETIVAAPLMLIRVKDKEKTDPAFLAWLLSQPEAQGYLNGQARGTALPTITKAALESTPLVLPDIARQRLIAEITTLSAEIRRLTHMLADSENDYINALLTR